MYSITTDLDKVQKKLIFDGKRLPGEMSKVVSASTKRGHRFLVKTLSKRSGTLRRSYIPKKENKYTWTISSNLKYAETIESGSRPHVIQAKRAKYLTIPTMRNQLVLSGAQIRKFNIISTIFSRDKQSGVMRTSIGDIILKKKVYHPGYRGSFKIKNEVVPYIDSQLKKGVREVLRTI